MARYYNPRSRRMRALCSAKLDDFIRTEDLSLTVASERPGYHVIWPSQEEEDASPGLKKNIGEHWSYCRKPENGDNSRKKALRCLREADAIADAGGGTVRLDPDLKQKKLVDLGGDVVASLSLTPIDEDSDVVSAYSLYRITGEPVERTDKLLQKLRDQLTARAPAEAARESIPSLPVDTRAESAMTNDYYNPHSRRMRALCSAKLDDTIRVQKLPLKEASKRPGYHVIWPSQEEEGWESLRKNIGMHMLEVHKDRNGASDRYRKRAIECLQAADVIADAGGGTVRLDPDLMQKKLVDLGGDVVASLSLTPIDADSDVVSAYSLYRITGEPVERTDELLQELRDQLTARAAVDGDDDDDDEDAAVDSPRLAGAIANRNASFATRPASNNLGSVEGAPADEEEASGAGANADDDPGLRSKLPSYRNSMTHLPDYVISLAHPGEPLLESSCYTSRTIEDIPHGGDGRTVTVRFDHIADNDGCRDFTDGWANTNQDGRKKKGQKEWNQMQKESKKNKLKKMFDKDGELFAQLVANAIANGDAVPSAGAADDARSHVRTSARARVRAESDAGERLSHENGEQTRAGEEKTEDDGDDDFSARNHEDYTTMTDPRMNFKSIGEIGRTTIVKTRKTLTLGMIDEALSGTNVIKAEGSDPEYYAPVMQRLRSELVIAKAGGGKSVNFDAPALDAAWLHDGIKKMNRYYKDEKNQLQDYGGYLYDKFSAAVRAKDLVTMALCLRQVEVAEGKSGNNPFVCSPWYRQYEVDLSQDPSYTPAIRDTSPIEIDEGPRVYELQSDDDEDDDGGDDGTGTGGAGRATANVKAESDMEIEECGEVGEERAVGGKSKAAEMEMDKDGHGEKNMSKRQKKTNGSASDCNDGLRAVAGNSFAGASTTMVLGSDASNGEAAAAAAGEVAGGSGGRKTTGEGGHDDMEEEREEVAEDAPLAIGTKIRKFFSECNSWHNGTIEAVPAPGDKSDYFHVCYDDGDDEDLDESEAKKHAQCWKNWIGTQSNGGHDTSGGLGNGRLAFSKMPLFGNIRDAPIIEVKRLDYYTPTIQLLLCYGWLCPRLLELKTHADAYKVAGYEGMMADEQAKRSTIKSLWKKHGQTDEVRPHLMRFIRDAHAAAAVPGGPPLPPAAVGKALVELVRGSVSITAVPDLGSDKLEDYSFYNSNTGESVEQTGQLLDQLQAAVAARAAADGDGDDEMPPADNDDDGDAAEAAGAHGYYDGTSLRNVLTAFARIDPRTRDKSFEAASKQLNYTGMYMSGCKYNKQWRKSTKVTNSDAGRMSSLQCIREAEANADAANGQVQDAVLEGKRLVDLANNITAVPSLSSDDISAYSFVNRITGEPVDSTDDQLQELRAALGPNIPTGAETAAAGAAAGIGVGSPDTNAEDEDDAPPGMPHLLGHGDAGNGGSANGANGGVTAPVAMPAPSAVPIQDVLGVLAISVLPPSSQHGTVRDALRNNPSAVVFAAMSEEMAQQQAAAAAATLPSREAGGSGSGAWSGMGSGGLIGRSEDDLLEMLTNLPASVLDGSVRDALRIDPSGLRLAANAMWMLKERRQGQMQHKGAAS